MSQGASSPFDFYRDMHRRRDAEELRSIAHVKRFIECFIGDPGFRAALADEPDSATALAAERGVEIDPHAISPLWKGGLRTVLSEDELAGYPLAAAWGRWTSDLRRFRDLMRVHGSAAGGDERFREWRLRRVSQADGELGDALNTIIHAVVTFELCDGCSVGCWFCGLSAKKLEGVFTYDADNATLWRDCVTSCRELLGPAMQTGFCYWATDPHDNPDYLRFVEEFRDITGELPQTTTALPFKDLEWTARLLDLYRRHPSVPPRFSILSTKVLRTIHDAFTPEDMLVVELVQQQDGSVVQKARAGRAAARNDVLGEEDGDGEAITDIGTIACVSGFLINMVRRSVKLISPCRSSEEHPLGYRTFEEAVFADGDELGERMLAMIERHMARSLPGSSPLRFRDDLDYRRADEGFVVSTRFRGYRFQGAPFVGDLGDIIAGADATVGETIGAMLGRGADYFNVTGAIDELFRQGLLEEGPQAGYREAAELQETR